MALEDRTNENIELSMPSMDNAVLEIDVDQDSSIHHEPWVWVTFYETKDDEDEFSWMLTMEEAERAYDRLGRILGKNLES